MVGSNARRDEVFVQELVKSPTKTKVINCKLVFKMKDGITSIEEARYKAWRVAKRYNQTQGIDFNDVFSPVVKHNSIHVLLALMVMDDLELSS